ncbi:MULTISPECIES: DUF2637 domain-containing protein [Streptomyces]|uniref:DUF2637 domain-containing protein n=1 Tax=Streptomyces tsukubensis (strain DSM 42081 / NBRC 108919 / NRRL 18488 / 9993) TaxID=1114943 RepID=I2N6J7_STRT9|nr:DUF2637 domain-containing protein [Streptomyces tsukubensis]MYS67849.1 DUF2637 domain-containing protein [Streptomyces sp. SID5473]AZK96614.1 hypothetical protein B7R87_24145 [Streptomyces tsukubensis]EIF92644.1 hypothetical protein [Streptomyces tsukubensis NRRL18488]QKM67383.1 DUF2637 domain-containing protein [Streptomyces tsukubensis NRRL18488]TAI42087.1 DUF2637 domain-containing protein [Streptomyces tsukubensis]
MTTPAPIPAHATTAWDKAAVVTLGAAACALSYDALQQMAASIHIRGALTYLFPLIIDGFIAYGVRGLLVLRTAPFTARLYTWALFGTASAVSIWANALHAVRLNQQGPPGAGLKLGDLTVGVLSTVAPLALAGAVHLYILIARRTEPTDRPGHSGQPDTPTVRTDRIMTDCPGVTDRPESGRAELTGSSDRDRPELTGPPDTDRPAPVTGHPAAELTAPAPSAPDTPSVTPAPVTLPDPEPEHTGRDEAAPSGEPDSRPAPDTAPTGLTGPEGEDELLPIARAAVTRADKVTRQIVADAIRGQGIPLANDRLTALVTQLRDENRPTRPGHRPAPVTATG